MGLPTTSSAISGEIVRTAPREAEHACEDMYDDEQDHTRCGDCKGTGWYVGFTERKYCPTCDGSGFM
jgi:hypothetical protein